MDSGNVVIWLFHKCSVVRSVRFPIDSGKCVKWLLHKCNSVRFDILEKYLKRDSKSFSDNSDKWLPPKSNFVRHVRFSMDSGKTVSWLSFKRNSVRSVRFPIDSGNVVAEGSHEELMKNSPIYKNFYNKQIKM